MNLEAKFLELMNGLEISDSKMSEMLSDINPHLRRDLKKRCEIFSSTKAREYEKRTRGVFFDGDAALHFLVDGTAIGTAGVSYFQEEALLVESIQGVRVHGKRGVRLSKIQQKCFQYFPWERCLLRAVHGISSELGLSATGVVGGREIFQKYPSLNLNTLLNRYDVPAIQEGFYPEEGENPRLYLKWCES